MTELSSPELPVVLWDGECGFCRRWVDHWREVAGETVEFRAFQAVPGTFLESHGLDREQLPIAMHFVDGEGRVHRGAGAVFAALRHSGELPYRVLDAVYRRAPPFAVVVDAVYAFIAAHRVGAARVTKALWGKPHRSTYQVARFLLLRGLAVASFLAFWSMSRQILGLMGEDGILPVADFMERARVVLDSREPGAAGAWLALPTVFWTDASDAALVNVCRVGMAASVALFLGIVPRLTIALLWVLYLSICSVGQVFLGYQWDALLLESLFVAWFIAPWAPIPMVQWRQRTSWLGRVLVWLVLFKLMFLAGWVKITTDEVWVSLRALDYHFWTQPIPNNIAWWFDQLPGPIKAAGVAFTLVAELAAPLLIFAPRRLRHLGAILMIALQLCIMFTGTYGFFNILTLALCAMLFDDAFFRGVGARASAGVRAVVPRWLTVSWAVGALVLGPLVLLPLEARLSADAENHSAARRAVGSFVAPFRTFNSYGLFGSMTRTRPEIVVEHSSDGVTWKPYDFRWKPTNPDEPLRFTTLHMPRLDWQMWFAALGSCERNPWYHRLVEQLLHGSEVVGGLLHEPPSQTPRFVRSRYFEYRFADDGWWTREVRGAYCPTFTLNEQGNLEVAASVGTL